MNSNKNNARHNLSSCVEFRSKKEIAIAGNVDGEKTWNNLDQNVLRKIFLSGGFTTAMPASCVCKYWRDVGKPIARELNPIKGRIMKQLGMARKLARKNSYYSYYDDSSSSDEEDVEEIDEAKLKRERESVRKFVIDKEEEITQKRLDNALLLREGEAQRHCKFRYQRRRYGGHYNLFNIRNSVARLLLPPVYSDGGKIPTKKLLDDNWGLWDFAARLFHREERTGMNKLLRVYVSRQMVYRRRALMVGFEQLGIPARFLDSAKYRKVREFIEYGEGHVLGARRKKRTVRVQNVLESMFNVYNQGQGEARMAESVLRFNEVKATVLRELKSFEDDKALGERAFKMHFVPKEKKKKAAATKAKTTKKEKMAAKVVSKKKSATAAKDGSFFSERKSTTDFDESCALEASALRDLKLKRAKKRPVKDENNAWEFEGDEGDREKQEEKREELPRPVAKKMKIKEEEVVEEDSAPKIFGKTKNKRVKKEKALGSEALPLPVVVSAPDAKPMTLPETRRSSRARKPSKAAAAALAAATEMKATGNGKKRCKKV